jgi:hypothetical protein
MNAIPLQKEKGYTERAVVRSCGSLLAVPCNALRILREQWTKKIGGQEILTLNTKARESLLLCLTSESIMTVLTILVKPGANLMRCIKDKKMRATRQVVVLPCDNATSLLKKMKPLCEISDATHATIYLQYKELEDLQQTEPQNVLEAARFSDEMGGDFNWGEVLEPSRERNGQTGLLLAVLDGKSKVVVGEHPSFFRILQR